MKNSELVKYVYERFTQGDAASVLATFHRDVEFRLAEGHPYQPEGKAWIGADAIIQNFFMKAGSEWEEWRISYDELLDMGDAVIVECRYAGIYKPTGRKMDVQVCHVWRFGNGKIKSFHQYLDTARLQKVMLKS
jgi:hypothetical protein